MTKPNDDQSKAILSLTSDGRDTESTAAVTSSNREDEEAAVRDLMVQHSAKLEGKLASFAKHAAKTKDKNNQTKIAPVTENTASRDVVVQEASSAPEEAEENSAPRLLRGGAVSTVPRPGALAVAGPGRTTQEDLGEEENGSAISAPPQGDEENPGGAPAREEPLLNARLVEESENNNDPPEIVEAKPALEGFAAILRNRQFKYVAAGFLLILLGVVVPLAVVLPKQGDDGPAIVLQGPEVCGSADVNQADYRGTISETAANVTCQRWDQQEPHSHKFLMEDFTGFGLEENYCRNPDGEAKPWCYTTDPGQRWQYCDVPYCSGNELVYNDQCGTEENRQADYRGTIAITATGKKCQRWDSQHPHNHVNSPEGMPGAGLEENYCRNPDREPFAWCYTEDPDTRWEYCDVTLCGSITLESDNKTCTNCTKQQCGTERLHQADYRGNINTTRSGRTCQRWDSQEPHWHIYDPESNPDLGLEENYCRNSNPASHDSWDRWAWCLTTDPNKRIDFCDVPFCEDDLVPKRSCGTLPDSQTDYRGAIAVSASGKDCQFWNTAAEAIANGHTPKDRPHDGLIGNFCRNPGYSQPRAWCYVAGSSSTWEFCDVPDCKECGSVNQWKEDYRGTVSTTANNKTCLHWRDITESEYSHHPLLEENYCRNPDGERNTVWCYTNPESLDWEYCDVPDCQEETKPEMPSCGSLAFRQSDYRGQINHTASGHACQPWNQQAPHSHKYVPEEHPSAGLDENYCRQPDDSEFLAWCFVDDESAGVRWEHCDVPICEDLRVSTQPKRTDCGTKSLKQKDYSGNINTTLGGWTCQEWGVQYPHQHRFSPESNTDLAGNSCRNPDGSFRAWCYTTNPDVVWEYCDIPICQGGVDNP